MFAFKPGTGGGRNANGRNFAPLGNNPGNGSEAACPGGGVPYSIFNPISTLYWWGGVCLIAPAPGARVVGGLFLGLASLADWASDGDLSWFPNVPPQPDVPGIPNEDVDLNDPATWEYVFGAPYAFDEW